jgi:hypothetical protein
MELNAYQLPQNNNIYIQQNLITAISPNSDNDSIHVFVDQSLSYKQVLGQNILPLTTEIGVELNHYFQTSIFCSYTFQNFFIDDAQTSKIDNFWYCGNTLAVVPYAASVIHPKIKLFGGAGQAYGTEQISPTNKSNLVLYFWTLKPAISIETNISESFKFSLGAGYQFVFSSSSEDLSNCTSGFEGIASLSYHFK